MGLLGSVWCARTLMLRLLNYIKTIGFTYLIAFQLHIKRTNGLLFTDVIEHYTQSFSAVVVQNMISFNP